MEQKHTAESMLKHSRHLAELFSAALSVPSQIVLWNKATQNKAFDPTLFAQQNSLLGDSIFRHASTAQSMGGGHVCFCPDGSVCLIAPVVFRSKPIAAVLVGPFSLFPPSKQSDHSSQKQAPLRLFQIFTLMTALFAPNETAMAPYDYIAQTEEKLQSFCGKKMLLEAETAVTFGLSSLFSLFSENITALKNHCLQFSLMLCQFLSENAETQCCFSERLHRLYLCEDANALCLCMQQIQKQSLQAIFPEEEQQPSEAIAKALRYIRQNYRNKISLNDIAEHVFLSPTYFSKKFKEEIGKNFNQYVNEIRTEQAKHLLKNTNYGFSEIAADTGFETLSYFSKVFRRITGLSPSAYRRLSRAV